VRIFATDLDPAAIAFARRGIYPASALSEVPPAIVGRYFLAEDGSYEVTRRIRGLVVFGEHDLGERAPFPRMDLCLCRNVLIYFTPALQRRALELFAFALRESGYLVLGKSESTSPLPDYFAPVDLHDKIYRRRGERVLLPPESIARAVPPVAAVAAAAAMGGMSSGVTGASVAAAAERSRNLLHTAPFGLVTVDSRYDIVDINPAARRLLDLHGPAVGDDLLHLLSPTLVAALRPLIDAVLVGEVPPSAVVTLPGPTAADATTDVQVVCYQPAGDDGRAGARGRASAALLLTDISALTERARALEHAAAEGRGRVADLEVELARERTQAGADRDRLRALLRANDELVTGNEALREENETLLVSNEEAQAATEEVETLNEELQATNEELQTLNEELQATVEELNTTNDDLQMRSEEASELAIRLQAQRAASERRRAALAAMLHARDDAVVVVDATGAPVLGNAAYARLAGGIDAVIDLADAEGRTLPSEAMPQRRAARGEVFSMDVTIAGADGARRRVAATGEPFGDGDATQGGVLVLRDRGAV
jgi:two-component system CheB/CheR fusion protein